MAVIRIEACTLTLPLPPEAARPFCQALEAGDILHLGPSPIAFSADELGFLRDQKKTEAGYHKNVAYRPKQDRLIGWRGPLRGCAARPACAHAGLGARGPKPALRLAGAAPNSLPGGGPPCGISQPFAPILPAGKAARPPRQAMPAPTRPACRP